MAELWLSADDIAVHFRVTKDTAYTWIAEKAMSAHKVGRLASEIDLGVRGCAGQRPRGPAATHANVGACSYAHDDDEHGKGRR